MRQDNEIQMLFREQATTKPAKALLARIDKLHDTLNAMEYRGLPQSDRKRLRDEGIQALTVDLMGDLAAERQKVGEQLLHVKEKYEKDYYADLPRHSFEISKFERKFRAMDDKELLQVLTMYVGDESSLPFDPNIVDALSGALRERGKTPEFQAVREAAIKYNYNLPHLKTDEGQMLQKQLKLNADVPGGGVLVEIEGEGMAAFSVDQLTEGV